MNKSELITAVATDTGLSKSNATTAVESFFDNISKTLIKKEAFQLIGFGTFSTGIRKAREGRNPSTGEVIHIPTSTSVRFKVGKTLKEAINE